VEEPGCVLEGNVNPSPHWIVWLAQGMGIGRIPFAPGTWGSVLGVAWYLLLLRLACEWQWLWPIGIISGILVATWVCARTEKILKKKDPQSVVLDEIVAVPLAMFTLTFFLYDFQNWAVQFLGFKRGNTGGPVVVVTSGAPVSSPAETIFADWFIPAFAIYIAIHFTLFRLFDIWKPWPIRQSQRLPGGWGVVMDDVLAAVYVNLVMLAAWGGMRWMD
jgi:phosphatidylglycerophosphatase A